MGRPGKLKWLGLGGLLAGVLALPLQGQEKSAARPVSYPAVPLASAEDRPLPINLLTAMKLAGATPLDIALASQRVEAAAAQLQKANLFWLPTLHIGVDYFRHDGQIQD